MIKTGEPNAIGERIAWFGLIVVAMLCIARAMIEHDPFPWWSSDPFVFSPPIVGLTPRWALLMHAAMMISSVLFLVGQHLRGIRLSGLNAALLAIGFAVLGYHAWADIERVLNASGIAAVVCVLIVASQAHTLPGARRVLGSVALGFAMMLTSVGVYEVFVSHPMTMRVYEQGRDAFLSARGWNDGSFEAMAYERRLRNPEPIAWFGLTNVYASFVAASAAGLFAMAITNWRAHRKLAVCTLIGSLIAMYALVLTGSKGGFGVLTIGLGLGIAIAMWPTRRIMGGIVLALCGLVVLGLLVRGLFGESLGERSLLFRYQYLVGGLNIWLHDPLLGCGPGMFQDRYALLKPRLSPEDVASPHSVMLSWIATLGIGGIALVVLLCRTLGTLCTPNAECFEDAHDSRDTERDTKIALLLIVLPALLSLQMQVAVLTPGGLLPPIIGAVIWGSLSLVIIKCRMPEHALYPALFIVAGVLMLHAMLEVTGTLLVSGPLWALMIGIACGVQTGSNTSKRGNLVGGIAMLGLCIVLLGRWATINGWERSLHGAARQAAPISQVHAALNGLEFNADPARELHRIGLMLSEIVDRPVGGTLDSVIPTLTRAELGARTGSVEHLLLALDARPSHTPTRVALSQQLLWLASVAHGGGQIDLAIEHWDRATGLFAEVELDANGHRWAGNIWAGRASAFPGSDRHDEWIEQARQHWMHALELAPNDPHAAVRLMEASIDLGDAESARDWARRAVELHRATRLDPLRGLSRADLSRASAIGGD